MEKFRSYLNSLIEQLFEKNNITWMMPKLNPEMYGSCCITIQSFHYETDDKRSFEYFRHITYDNRRMRVIRLLTK